MAKSLISMLEIADVICEDFGDVTKRYRGSILRHLATCNRKLQMFVSDSVDIATFVSPVSRLVHMPSDFIYETKVGLRHGNKIVFLDKNYEEKGVGPLEMNQSEARVYVEDVLFKGRDCDHVTPFYNHRGELLYAYGRGIKCKGLYTVDTKKGIIHIGSEFPPGCEIVVEYCSDGVSQGEKMVPIEFYDSLYNYGAWKHLFQRKDPRYRQSAADYDEAYYQLETLCKFVPINYIVSLFQQEMHTVNDRL